MKTKCKFGAIERISISEKHEISTQKTSALMRQLAQSGKVEVSEVKVKGSGIVKGYTIVTEN